MAKTKCFTGIASRGANLIILESEVIRAFLMEIDWHFSPQIRRFTKRKEGSMMRSHTRCVLAYLAACSLMLFLSSALCSAQNDCAERLKSMIVHCAGPNNCHGSVTIEFPFEPNGGSVMYRTSAVPCCGQLITDVDQIGECSSVALAGIEEQLARLAEVSDVLVANCAGRYVPYKTIASAKPASRLATGDRVLSR
jgi:hypothetical protein